MTNLQKTYIVEQYSKEVIQGLKKKGIVKNTPDYYDLLKRVTKRYNLNYKLMKGINPVTR